ncbi:MAG: hypothetical protein ABFC31_00045 [Clostridiaceae bacterium]
MTRIELLKSMGWSNDLINHFFSNCEEATSESIDPTYSEEIMQTSEFTLKITPSANGTYTISK